MEELSCKKRVRVDSVDPEFDDDSTKSKKIRDDLLSLLDESDTVLDRDSASYDLDSVIRSFEEEIETSGSGTSYANMIDLTEDTGEVPPKAGEFSGRGVEVVEEAETRGGDVSQSELVEISAELSGIGEWWDFQDELTSYDSFGVGIGYEQNYENNNGYVALDGVFDYSDVNFGADNLWRPDTLSAL